MIVVGSMALSLIMKKAGIEPIKPKDIDIICHNAEEAEELYTRLRQTALNTHTISLIKSDKFDTCTRAVAFSDAIVEITWPLDEWADTSTTDLLASSVYWKKDHHSLAGFDVKVPPLNILYSLKMSHRYLRNAPSFLKTMRDIHIMRSMGAAVYHYAWLEKREKETYNYAHPDLGVDKSKFFNSNFNYVYDHDSIHEAVARLEKPAYMYYIADGEEVKCSKEKFFEQERTIQILGVLEETMVLALERSQIPTDFTVDPRVSFMIALEKVCTSITSGWFREFAWENYKVIANLYSDVFVRDFKIALANGLIKPYKGETE